MRGKIKLFSLGVVILSLSPVGLVFAAAGDILDSFTGLPGRHAHGGAASGGLVWESASTNKAIIEFDCDGTFLREIPSPVGGFNSGLAYDPNTNTFWHANGGSTISHLDINGNLLGTIAAGRDIYSLTLDTNTQTLWGGRRGVIHQYEIGTGHFLRTISIPTSSPFPSLGFDGQFLWVSGFGNRRVWQIDPDAAVPILQTFTVTGSGGVVAHDSQDLWTFNEGSNQIQRVDDGIGPSDLPCFRGVLLELEKEIVSSGPEEIGIYLPFATQSVFEIAYTGPAALVVDTVPAEFEVVSAVATDGDPIVFDTSKGKGNSANRIEWLVPAGSNTLTVVIQTVASPGEGHMASVFKPTSCGPLVINDGANALEVDENGDLVLVEVVDPETGEATLEFVVIVGPSNPLIVEAVAGAKPCVEEEAEEEEDEGEEGDEAGP